MTVYSKICRLKRQGLISKFYPHSWMPNMPKTFKTKRLDIRKAHPPRHSKCFGCSGILEQGSIPILTASQRPLSSDLLARTRRVTQVGTEIFPPHGPPGVGKIYTAECIAELIRECLRAQIKYPCIVNCP